MRQIKKNEREAHTFPAEALEGEREKCHLDILFHGGEGDGWICVFVCVFENEIEEVKKALTASSELRGRVRVEFSF